MYQRHLGTAIFWLKHRCLAIPSLSRLHLHPHLQAVGKDPALPWMQLEMAVILTPSLCQSIRRRIETASVLSVTPPAV